MESDTINIFASSMAASAKVLTAAVPELSGYSAHILKDGSVKVEIFTGEGSKKTNVITPDVELQDIETEEEGEIHD
jgi:hypothetical protein